jgi:hypothetical protein
MKIMVVMGEYPPEETERRQKAEADGFNAVVPFGTLDVGVEMSRNLVRIPVVGAG